MGPTISSETSVRTHYSALRKIPKERRPQLISSYLLSMQWNFTVKRTMYVTKVIELKSTL